MAERIFIFRFHSFAGRSKCQAQMQNSRIARILAGALHVWGVNGTVSSERPGAFLVLVPGHRVAVQHDGAGWTIVVRDSVERHAGLPGVLRSLRAELAPDAPAGRLIIAAA